MKLSQRLLAVGFAAAVTLAPFTAATATPAHAEPVAGSTASATSAASAVTRVAEHLAAEYTADPSSFTGGGLADTILALASSGSHGDLIATMVKALQADAKNYVSSAGSAGKVAIVAAAPGADPTNFGGIDLIDYITTALAKDKTAGGTFSAPLAIIGLVRHGAPVPESTIEWLLGQQDASGAFGYDWNGFNPDADTTASVIAGLVAIKDQPGVADALTKAITWAKSTRTSAGYWDNFSPVNTTGLMSAALDDAGQDTTTSVAWLNSQVLADGGMPNYLGGDESNLMAASQGILGLTGMSYATVTFVPISTPTPTSSQTPPTSAPAPSQTPKASAPVSSAPVTSAPVTTVSITPSPSTPAAAPSSSRAPLGLPATGAPGLASVGR